MANVTFNAVASESNLPATNISNAGSVYFTGDGTTNIFKNDGSKIKVGASKVSKLDDVDISIAPTAGQALVYDATLSKWKPGNVSVSSSISTLTDVTIGNPSNGQALIYDASSAKWKPGDVSSSGTVAIVEKKRFAVYQVAMSAGFAVGSKVPVFGTPVGTPTIVNENGYGVVDSNTFKMKAGRIYKFHGGIQQYTMTSGIVDVTGVVTGIDTSVISVPRLYAYDSPSVTQNRANSIDTIFVAPQDCTIYFKFNTSVGTGLTMFNFALTVEEIIPNSGTVVDLPVQGGNAGKALITDGTTASWGTISSLPSMTGNSNKVLSTDGTTAMWITAPSGGGSSSADAISVTTSNFNKNLTPTENTVQKALDKLDDMVAQINNSVTQQFVWDTLV